MIGIENIYSSESDIRSAYPDAVIIDTVSVSTTNHFARLSPYYVHGDIAITYPEYARGISINDLWQNLCVYHKDENGDKLFVGIKGATYGTVYPVNVARKKILATAYRWMLEHKAMDIINYLRWLKQHRNIVLLDTTMNYDMDDTMHPFSHAYLVKAYVEGLFPYEDVIETITIGHCYVGRFVRTWTTQKRRYKNPQNKEIDYQLAFDFDDS